MVGSNVAIATAASFLSVVVVGDGEVGRTWSPVAHPPPPPRLRPICCHHRWRWPRDRAGCCRLGCCSGRGWWAVVVVADVRRWW